MFKTIMSCLAAIAIYARALELNAPPVLAVACGLMCGYGLWNVYSVVDKLSDRKIRFKDIGVVKWCITIVGLSAYAAKSVGMYLSRGIRRKRTSARYAGRRQEIMKPEFQEFQECYTIRTYLPIQNRRRNR